MSSTSLNESSRQVILDAIHHLDHVLPGQAPIHDFVHHNTLHGFQHLPFEEALAEYSTLTGTACYLSDDQFREFYRQGRIGDADLDMALAQVLEDGHAEVGVVDGKPITRQMLWRLALTSDLQPLTPAQFNWQVQELDVLDKGIAGDAAPRQVWNTVLAKLELQMPDLHPENLLDLSGEQAESWHGDDNPVPVQLQMRQRAFLDMTNLFAQVGDNLTLRGLLLAMTGADLLDAVRPQLIRLCASLLDEGMAAWRLPHRQELGLYQAWRHTQTYDAQPIFQELHDWQALIDALPEDAVDAIIQQLEVLAIPTERWSGYLQRLALELPGWSGLINWRQTHPAYHADDATQPLLADYLAIRLLLDRAYAQVLCGKVWHCDARFDKLEAYFRKNLAEFAVRQALFRSELPEYLTQAGHALLADNARQPEAWQTLAERIWTWLHSPLADSQGRALSVYDHAWRIFRICQLLTLDAPSLRDISKSELLEWVDILDGFDQSRRSEVWLNAYERNYRQNLLQALHANHGRGRWARREKRPEAQIFFCMDEREESFRRHLEELNPAVETLGAAGFFGVAMNYKALDDHHVTAQCPVVVTPAHTVEEVVAPGHEARFGAHRAGLSVAERLGYWLYQSPRRGVVAAFPLTFLFAPLQLARLLAKSLLPTAQRHLERLWQALLVPKVPTRLRLVATEAEPATPVAPRLGFSDREQADRVEQFLKTTGLTHGFAPIVAIMGHGSTSQNNPHEAAHDCGACGGRRGGPNARVFAAMANRPEVRDLLSQRGINIPEDTWFVGGQHDTCSDQITWYELEQMPGASQNGFARFQATLIEADRRAAAERCRRFASSGYPRSPLKAIRHVENRSVDLSQVRPEFGHATNAAAYIGRRSATQGVFFDRRLFLISYDPTQDADGAILENILLTAGPVGAGINLEYYFSTVNNDRLGCGTKIPHNVTGLFGVMEGASSDLRTGLPLQMVEIHEAMRLQIVVEAKIGVLEQIYARQESLQELIGGGWVHLNAQDPDSGEISVFRRGAGFVAWRPADCELPLRDDSADCYRRSTDAVAPMLIKQPATKEAA